MKRLRTHIKNYSKKARTSGDFKHSHEILFNQNISLEKYCVCIINDGWKDEKIINNLDMADLIYIENMLDQVKQVMVLIR